VINPRYLGRASAKVVEGEASFSLPRHSPPLPYYAVPAGFSD
jgi:hypothetical protein